MKYILELPYDEYGNRMLTNEKPKVLKVGVKKDARGNFVGLVVDESFANKFVKGAEWGWAFVKGPVREMTEQEYVQLLRELGAPPKYIRWAESRLPKGA